MIYITPVIEFPLLLYYYGLKVREMLSVSLSEPFLLQDTNDPALLLRNASMSISEGSTKLRLSFTKINVNYCH